MSRFIVDDTECHAAPLKTQFCGMDKEPEPDFLESVGRVEDAGAIPDAREIAELTLMSAEDRSGVGGDLQGLLPVNNLCAILKYCVEDSSPPFYEELNRRCYLPDRGMIKPFVSFIWLLMKTLEMLPPYLGSVVNRGVKANLKDKYPEGKKFIWHGFTSTTKDVGVLSNPMFLGTAGDRTIFQIELTQKQARDISKYSPLAEDEVLLPPGSRFKVKGVLHPAEGLTIIQLVEIRSPAWILDLRPKVSIDHKEMMESFSKFDVDDDGVISVAEMKTVLIDLGMDAGGVNTLFEYADKDGSGELDFLEFARWLCSGGRIARDLPQILSEQEAEKEDANSRAEEEAKVTTEEEPPEATGAIAAEEPAAAA